MQKILVGVMLVIAVLFVTGCSLITVKANIPVKFTVVETSDKDGVKTYQVETFDVK